MDWNPQCGMWVRSGSYANSVSFLFLDDVGNEGCEPKMIDKIFFIIALIQGTVAVLDQHLHFLAKGQGTSLILCMMLTFSFGLGIFWVKHKHEL